MKVWDLFHDSTTESCLIHSYRLNILHKSKLIWCQTFCVDTLLPFHETEQTADKHGLDFLSAELRPEMLTKLG